MTEQELKKEQFIAKAMENKEKFTLHKKLIEEILCVGGKMYIEDLKVFAERQVVDNQLLLNLMEYAENFAKETMKKAIIDAYDQGRSDEETRFPFAFDGEDYYSLKILNASSKAE